MKTTMPYIILIEKRASRWLAMILMAITLLVALLNPKMVLAQSISARVHAKIAADLHGPLNAAGAKVKASLVPGAIAGAP